MIKHDTEQSLKLINSTLDNFREEYKLKLNIMNNDLDVKALNQFKKNLILNKNSKIINGRLLPEPPDKIRRNYKIINSIVEKSGLSFDKNNNKINLNRLNEQKNYNLRSKTISKFKNVCKFKNLSSVPGHNRFNDFYHNKDFTIVRVIRQGLRLNIK